MKKLFTSLMLLLTVVVLIFTLCACGGENGEEKNAPSNELEKVECEHKEWKLVSSLEATCENAGYNNLECRACGETKTNYIPQKPCDYEVSWEWGGAAYTTTIRFKCPRTNAHNQVKNAFQHSITVIKEATCQEYGEKLYYANVRDKYDRRYTAEKIEKYEVDCCMVTEITPATVCYGTVTWVNRCQWCGKEKTSTYSGNHTAMKEVERYNLADYGYCGGYIVRQACQCGEDSVINIHESCTLTETTETTETPFESGSKEIHKVTTWACSECGFKIVKKEGNFVAKIVDGETTDFTLYKIMEIVISEDVTVKKILESESGIHKAIDHTLKTEYEYLGEECSDGYYINIKCQDCAYEERNYKREHTYQERKINLADYGACSGILVVEECRCGVFRDAYFRSTENECTFEDIPASEYLGYDINTSKKALKCTKCGFSCFFGRIYYETGEELLYYSFELYSARINDETVLEKKQFEGVVIGYVDYDICGQPLTNEEKKNIIDYLERSLNDNISEYWRESYQKIIERLQNELSEIEDSKK